MTDLHPWNRGRNTSEDIADELDIHYETPGGAQQRADTALTAAKLYTDTEIEELPDLVGGIGITVTDNIVDNTKVITATGVSLPTAHASTHVTGGTDVIPNVVADGNSGLMTGTDKTKLNGVATGANNYAHPNHTGDITSVGDGITAISAGVIIDADVNASAAIGWTKLSKTGSSLADLTTKSAGDLSSGTLLAARLPALTGDITMTAGTTTTAITTGVIVNADINASAAIDPTKIGTGVVSSTEFSYLDGVTSSIQTQFSAKASLDGGNKILISQLPDSVFGQLEYQGTWNATTNTPTLATASTVKGYYYVVSVAGTYLTIAYNIGDWIVSNGTGWEKVDNTDAVPTVFGRTGNVISATNDYTWAQIDKTSSSLADIATKSAGDLNSGTLLAARLPAVSGDITMVAGTGVSSITAGSIVDADINSSAAIAWTKISKTGSSLVDLATRSAGDLNSGTLLAARLPTGIDAANIGTGVVSNTEFSYLDGATSSIQNQINAITNMPSWTAPTLQNGWVNFGGAEEVAGYTKDSLKYVHIRGLVKSGTAASLVFTLPVGYRPLKTQRFPLTANAAFGEMTIDPTGGIYFSSTTSTTYVSMLIPPFLAEQ